MKRLFLILAAFAFLILAGCTSAIQPGDGSADYRDDPRLEMVDAMDAKFLRLPARARGIADGDPIAAYCDEPGWSYIFFDDAAVIGYEPFPDNIAVMHEAVRMEVNLHNRDNPDKPWDYINVSVPVIPPDTSHDPTLEKWRWALCLDDGTIVDSYQCESLEEFQNFKTVDPWHAALITQLNQYNMMHDSDAHIVWGPDA